ncbi:G-protein coupled receptors family 1 profile domain-containing protein [Caenorhabditis elegans]|uniref:G-protein coupled receptors family 1 profile domain-containing protein n=1 Tax=Caenorhabditis elegans TaxID=6239 RepID=C7FZU0_CAEEL|nr:G-protein coupled receptors family 1 profile domain-containing protein [Caenorhabditis elegans]CBA11610.1 G-protein coupled receptors family 1 profile domain-containing protein [Caenorhabditis elegans]|eukprot:NP_001256281.1 FMRFamide Peptide Receptor family [Caenorhabditis elegans]
MTSTVIYVPDIQELPECEPSVFNDIQATIRLFGGMPIAIFGFITNVINVIVFCDPEMRCSLVNHFLLVLSISDLVLLVCNFFMLIFPVIASMSNSYLLHDYYPVFLWFAYPVGLSTQTCGVYLTVLVSVHRYLGVCHPFRAKRWVSGKPVKWAIIGSIIFSIVINLHTWLELDIRPCYSINFNAPISSIILTSLRQKSSYNLITKCIMYTLIMFIIPFITLIIVNCRIVVALKESTRMRNGQSMKKSTQSRFTWKSLDKRIMNNFRMLKGAKYSELFGRFGRLNFNPLKTPSLLKTNGNSLRDRSVTLMLLAIVAIFLCCNCLAFCNNIYENVQHVKKHASDSQSLNQTSFVPEIEEQSQDYDGEWSIFNEWNFDLSVEISNLLISLNSSSSMFVYLIFSSKYRSIIKHWLGLEKRKRTNGVALTTVMAAQKALELSILPDEVEARRHRKEKSHFVKNKKQMNKSAQLFLTTSEIDLRKARTIRKEQEDEEEEEEEIREIQSDEPSAASNLSRDDQNRSSSKRKLLRFATLA